jgi:hypothetical protein
MFVVVVVGLTVSGYSRISRGAARASAWSGRVGYAGRNQVNAPGTPDPRQYVVKGA